MAVRLERAVRLQLMIRGVGPSIPNETNIGTSGPSPPRLQLVLTGGHKVLEVFGKAGKERRIPLHPEAMERIEAWLDVAAIRDDSGDSPLFRAAATARAQGRDGFRTTPLTRRAIQFLVKRSARELGLDPEVTVHSFRVTALTTAREQGVDIIDLQDFAGHSDPRTTLSYIRSRNRLSKSPAYTLRY